MKTQYDHHIEAILAGNSIGSEAKLAGVNMNTLRRILIKHPDYANAKAEGKLHQKGITPKLREAAETSPAVQEVLSGATLSGTAVKYGIPPASLAKMVHVTRPGLNLQQRGKAPDEVAAFALEKAKRALKRAQAMFEAAQ